MHPSEALRESPCCKPTDPVNPTDRAGVVGQMREHSLQFDLLLVPPSSALALTPAGICITQADIVRHDLHVKHRATEWHSSHGVVRRNVMLLRPRSFESRPASTAATPSIHNQSEEDIFHDAYLHCPRLRVFVACTNILREIVLSWWIELLKYVFKSHHSEVAHIPCLNGIREITSANLVHIVRTSDIIRRKKAIRS